MKTKTRSTKNKDYLRYTKKLSRANCSSLDNGCELIFIGKLSEKAQIPLPVLKTNIFKKNNK